MTLASTLINEIKDKDTLINLFKDRIFNSKDIIFNENDFGISSKNDIKNDSKLTNYFIEKGSKNFSVNQSFN